MSAASTTGARFGADITALLRARNPLLWIVTREEARAERIIFDAAAAASYDVRCWDCSTGVSQFDGRPVEAGCTDPAQVLAMVRDTPTRCAWILRDLPAWLRDPTVARAVRSLSRSLPTQPRDAARAMIVITPSSEVPPELAAHAIMLDLPMPDRTEIAALLDAALQTLPDEIREGAAPDGTRDAAVDATIGLSAEEAQSTFARSLIVHRRIDPPTIALEKRRVIARERVLEWHDPLPGGLDAVGGLQQLKAWLSARRAAFTPRARAYGLPAPKGVLMVGVPGCGKSLTAKAIATAWAMPLLRLDLGALRSKFVGESEGNIRRALKVAEAVAPCVLWLDEIEKALAGATQGAADGGVSADALGAVLQWMQDRARSVFVCATANDVATLPPELLRKGRFDEVFFVDTPNVAERSAILRAALKSYGRDPDKINIPAVASATTDFTGAELAALIPDAMFAAFADGEREVVTTDLVRSAHSTVPLARTASERITALRAWAKSKARPASAPEAELSTATRELDI